MSSSTLIHNSLMKEISHGSPLVESNEKRNSPPDTPNDSWRAPGSSSRRASIAPIYYSKTETKPKLTSSNSKDNTSNSADTSDSFPSVDLMFKFGRLNTGNNTNLNNRRQSVCTTTKPVFNISSLFKNREEGLNLNNRSRSIASPFFPILDSAQDKNPYKNRLLSVFEDSKNETCNDLENHHSYNTINNENRLVDNLFLDKLHAFSLNKFKERSFSEAFITKKETTPLRINKLKNYIVEFKNNRIETFQGTEDLNIINKNEYVIVEADRGKDLGKVLEIKDIVNNTKQEKIIYRLATSTEIDELQTKQFDELKALQHCRERIIDHNLDMDVLFAEYQFDRKKLTFFFSAKKRIDFRDLVKELFRHYKTRIWMCSIDR